MKLLSHIVFLHVGRVQGGVVRCAWQRQDDLGPAHLARSICASGAEQRQTRDLARLGGASTLGFFFFFVQVENLFLIGRSSSSIVVIAPSRSVLEIKEAGRARWVPRRRPTLSSV